MPRPLTAALWGLLTAFSVMAQTATGSLSGSVIDPTGGAIAGADVIAHHTPTGREFRTVTSDAGIYVFPTLEVGPYRISASRPGFKTLTREGLVVAISARAVLDLQMEIGDVTQNVRVSAEAEQLQSATSELSVNFAPKFMTDAPLFVGGGMRNPEAFVAYSPGVNTTNPTLNNGVNGTQDNSVNGGLVRSKEVLLDGATMTGQSGGGTVFDFVAVEQLGEFAVLTNDFSAEYGRTGGGVEIFVTKSGTNALHGSTFDFLRNDKFDSAGWAVNSVPGRRKAPIRQIEFGVALGGPVFIPKVYDGRNRTFFYFTFNGYRQNNAITYNPVTIPSAPMRNGDFSGFLDASGRSVPIYDPATTATVDGQLLRQPFPGNRIPADRFSSVSSKILPLIPQPNTPGLANNYLGGSGANVDRTMYSVKFDHAISDRNRFSVYINRQERNTRNIGTLPGPLSNGWVDYNRPDNYRGNHDFTLRPNLLNHVTFGFSRQQQYFFNPDQADNWPQKLGLKGVRQEAPNGFPLVSFASNGYTSFATTGGGKTQGSFRWYNWQFNESLTWIKGAHELKFGFDFRRQNVFQDPIDYSNVQGSFTFANFQTSSPAARPTTGNSFASFLLGAPDSGFVRYTALNRDTHFGYQSWFAQDNWKISHKLTLNLGLRYEIALPRWDANSEMSSFDPDLRNPAAGNIRGALAYAGSGQGHTGKMRFSDIDYREFGPRIGFAYAADTKTVVRGGYGVYYSIGNALAYGFCDTGCNFGFDAAPTLRSDGLQPAFLWDSGFTPPAGFVPPPVVDPSFANGSTPAYISRDSGRAPRVQNWTLDIQRQLPGDFIVDAAYAASRSSRLNYSPTINQVDPKYLALGSLLGRSITDPQVAAQGFQKPFPSFTGTLAQALRPYPQYSDVLNAFAPVGQGSYHALQAKVQRRFRTLTMFVGYTWSKTMTNGPFREGFDASGTVGAQNTYDFKPEKSLMLYDRPQVLSIIYSWDLPFGVGRRYLRNSPAAVRALVSGWTFSGLHQYESGSLIQVTVPNSLGNGVLYSLRTRPNVTGQPLGTGVDRTGLDPNDTNSRWLNPAGFAVPAPYTFGNAANFYNSVRNPLVLTENVALLKRTPIRESMNLEYRFEVSNPFNRTEFGAVQGSLTATNFGRPTGATYPPRVIQMALRLNF